MRIKFLSGDITNTEEYESIDDIEPCFYDNVIYINCHEHKLTSLEFINRFPNLRTLIASNNLLTYVPGHNKLEILDVNSNKIRNLGLYPNLLKLYAFNNLITQYNVPFKVFELDLSNNRLIKLNFNKKQIFTLFSIKYNNLNSKNTDRHNYTYENLSVIYE